MSICYFPRNFTGAYEALNHFNAFIPLKRKTNGVASKSLAQRNTR